MNFITRALLKKQMKGIPEAEQDKFIDLVEKNPEVFMKIAEQVKEKMKTGMSQMDASMAVMKENEAELKQVLGK